MAYVAIGLRLLFSGITGAKIEWPLNQTHGVRAQSTKCLAIAQEMACATLMPPCRYADCEGLDGNECGRSAAEEFMECVFGSADHDPLATERRDALWDLLKPCKFATFAIPSFLLNPPTHPAIAAARNHVNGYVVSLACLVLPRRVFAHSRRLLVFSLLHHRFERR